MGQKDKRDGIPNQSELRRDLGLTQAVAIGLGAVIGAGIFVVIGLAAEIAGPALLVGLLIAGLAATCNGLSSAELAAVYPQSGGTYEYGYRLLHPWLGFTAGWMFLVSKLAAAGTVALGFGGYFSQFFSGVSPRTAAVSAVVLLTTANYFGIKKAGGINMVIVSVTVLSLIYFVIAGVGSFEIQNFQPFAPLGWKGVAESAALLFFAYTGYARLATLGEEVADPKRTIPLAIVITLVLSILLYTAVALVAIGAVGAEAMAGSLSPLQRATRVFALPGVFHVVGLGATTAMLGVLLSQILGISRMLLAMARRGDLPDCLQHIHRTHGVPDYGIWFTGLVIVGVSLVGSLPTVAASAAFAILLYYTLTNLAALRLRPAEALYPKWISAVGLGFCVLMAVSLRPTTIFSGLGLLAFGFVLRWILRRTSRRPEP